MNGFNAVQFSLQGGVIGRVEGHSAALDFERIRLLSFKVNALPVKICQRTEARGVLTRVKARATRVAVDVDHITMDRGAYGCNTL